MKPKSIAKTENGWAATDGKVIFFWTISPTLKLCKEKVYMWLTKAELKNAGEYFIRIRVTPIRRKKP